MPTTSALEAVSAARWRIAISLTIAMMVVYFGFILLVAFNKPLLGTLVTPGLSLGMLLGVAGDPRRVGADVDLHPLGEHALRRVARSAARPRQRGHAMTSALGEPNAIAITFFLLFIALSLGITVWAAQADAERRNTSTPPGGA